VVVTEEEDSQAKKNKKGYCFTRIISVYIVCTSLVIYIIKMVEYPVLN